MLALLRKIRINDLWILDSCRQGRGGGSSAECTNTHTVRAIPHVFKKEHYPSLNAIHYRDETPEKYLGL